MLCFANGGQRECSHGPRWRASTQIWVAEKAKVGSRKYMKVRSRSDDYEFRHVVRLAKRNVAKHASTRGLMIQQCCSSSLE
jgi:hypothetical protein